MSGMYSSLVNNNYIVNNRNRIIEMAAMQCPAGLIKRGEAGS